MQQPTANASKPKNQSAATKTSDESRTTLLASHGYIVRKTIGHGSYASVKVAYSRRLRSKVAIKIISKRKAPAEFVRKFLPRELGLIKVLHHPHIVAFYQYIDTPNRVYLVMELAENGDLFQMLRANYIPEVRSAIWFCQILDAVNYCHNLGVVHRDLKCDNVLLDRNNNVKISDFGFAKLGVQGKLKPRDLSRTFCGSYPYACPEILKSEPYDPKAADVWSLGVILYVMMFRRLPFDDRNLKVLVDSQKNPIYFPTTPEVSNDCKRLINKILMYGKERYTLQDVRSDPWFLRMDAKRPPAVQTAHPTTGAGTSASRREVRDKRDKEKKEERKDDKREGDKKDERSERKEDRREVDKKAGDKRDEKEKREETPRLRN